MDKVADLAKLKAEMDAALKTKDFKTANEKGKARFELAKQLHAQGVKLEVPVKKSE